MYLNNTYTMTVITILIKSILKISLTYLGFMTVVVPIEQISSDQDVFIKLLDSVPSQIAVVLGVLYLASILFRRMSNDWSNHKINQVNVKKANEHLEQEEIITEEKRKDLEK